MSTYTRNGGPYDLAGLGFEASSVTRDGATTVTANVAQNVLQAAVDAAPLTSVQTAQYASELAFIRARFPAVLAKARAIMADPANAPAFTAAEQKVISAVVVLDVAQRLR